MTDDTRPKSRRGATATEADAVKEAEAEVPQTPPVPQAPTSPLVLASDLMIGAADFLGVNPEVFAGAMAQQGWINDQELRLADAKSAVADFLKTTL